ncbi:MAG: hypothetical protein IKD06_00405 [Clostridia bacterium]|nr:hypothetical protein [Clostridia bacterium]
MTPRQKYETRYKQALADLFLVALLSAVNIVALLTEATFSFPFSAVSPMIVYALGSAWAEQTGAEGYLIAGMILAVLIVGLFLVLWLFAKKRPGALLAATLFFAADTLGLLWFATTANALSEFMIDIVFHGVVLGLLAMGVNAAVKLRRMGDEPAPKVSEPVQIIGAEEQPLAEEAWTETEEATEEETAAYDEEFAEENGEEEAPEDGIFDESFDE